MSSNILENMVINAAIYVQFTDSLYPGYGKKLVLEQKMPLYVTHCSWDRYEIKLLMTMKLRLLVILVWKFSFDLHV